MRGVVSLIQRIFQFFSTYIESNNRSEVDDENKNEIENENIDDGANERNRKLTSRIILLLCTAIISKKDILFDNCGSTSLFRKKSFIPKMILKTVKNLFQHLKSVNEIKTVWNSSISEKTYQMKGQSYSDSIDHSKYHSNIRNNTTSSNYVIENNLDLLLEFQNSMSVMIPDVGIILLNKIDQIRVGNDVVRSHHNNGSNSNNHEYNFSKRNHHNSSSSSSDNVNNINENNNKDDDDDTSNDSDSDGMSDNNENEYDGSKDRDGNGNSAQNNFMNEERMFFMLLEASIFSAGITRHHSTDEFIRKLINKFNVIEIVSEELRAIGSFTVICQKRIISNTEKTKNEIISKFVGDEANKLCLKIINKLSEIVVQLVVIIRNYSIDSDGKSQLINTKIVGLLCSLLKPFKNYPELVLNCVRVTAKLSLQDNFRAQINSKTAQIKCLIDVLIQEGTICLDVMNGTSKLMSIDTYNHQNGNTSSTYNSENHHYNSDNNTNVTDSTSWPYWYTWPLISRIAFTLGNLTTSNSLNRCISVNWFHCHDTLISFFLISLVFFFFFFFFFCAFTLLFSYILFLCYSFASAAPPPSFSSFSSTSVSFHLSYLF